MKTGRYKRRIAALSFLTNISLDGSPRLGYLRPDSPPSHRVNKNTSGGDEEEIDRFDDHPLLSFKENLDPAASSSGRASKNVSPTLKTGVGQALVTSGDSSNLNVSSDSHSIPLSKFLDSDGYGQSNFFNLPFRERTSTIGSEYGSEKHFGAVVYRKRLLQQIPDDKLQGIFSSSESMVSAGGRNREVTFLKTLTKGQKLKGQRLVLLSQKQKIPVSVFSVIPYNKFRGDMRNQLGTRRRNTSGARPLSAITDGQDAWTMLGMEKALDGQEISYGQLLAPSKHRKLSESDGKHLPVARCYSHDSNTMLRTLQVSPPANTGDKSTQGQEHVEYEANVLDDPELIGGKHKRLLPFSSYTTSIILYVRAADLKKELNDKFKEKFPHIELTLSKLRSIKREMRKIAAPDLLTTAYSYVYFERLILKNVVNKENRKLCAGAALILAAKLNDIKGDCLKHFIERTESILRVNRKELLTSEFAVLVALEFGLHVPPHHVLPHYHRLVSET